MGVPEMTRRPLLRAGAGALAGAALRPGPDLPPRCPGARGDDRPRHRLGRAGRRTASGRGSHRTSVGGARFPVRFRDPRTASWRQLGPVGLRARSRTRPGWHASREHTGEALWVGGARTIQVRSGVWLTRARLCLVLEAPSSLAAGRPSRSAPSRTAGTRRRRRPAADPRANSLGKRHPAATCGPRLRRCRPRVRPSHGEPERLLRRSGTRDDAGDLPVPPRIQRLERHRLQLRRSTASDASGRPVRGESMNPLPAPRRGGTTSSRPAWPCSARSRARISPPPGPHCSDCWHGSSRCTGRPRRDE